MNVLNEICRKKLEHIAARRRETPLAALQDRIAKSSAPRGFIDSLRRAPAPAIIAEIKKASPSKGVIREDFNPAEIAGIYESNGASCLSVLTDEPYFQGHDDDLGQARAASNLPALRKDFMLDPYQIYESRAIGADCVLLIMAALSDEEALHLHRLSRELGMDVLVEIHDEPELRRALELQPEMIGINNRNLKTLSVDIQTSHTLVKLMPENILKVAESGISGPAPIRDLIAAGFNAFLVGESLMRQPDIGAALKILRG